MKSILSSLPVWLILLAFATSTMVWTEPLFAQDEPAAGDEKKAADEKEDEEKGQAGAVPAPSVGADASITSETNTKLSLYRTGEISNLTALKTLNTNELNTVRSLAAAGVNVGLLNTQLSSAGSTFTTVFGSDATAVNALLSAGANDATKLAAIVTSINSSLKSNSSGVSNAGFRRGAGDSAVALDAKKDIALLSSVVNFAKSVADPDGDFAKNVGGGSTDAWGKIELDGIKATVQGIESKTVQANDAGFDPAAVVAAAKEQITATSAFIVSELIKADPVDVKNTAGDVDFSNHFNGAVAQKLALDTIFAGDATKSLADLVGASATLVESVAVSAKTISDVSTKHALEAADTGTKFSFDFADAKHAAHVQFLNVESVKENLGAGETLATAFSDVAGASTAEQAFMLAETFAADPTKTFDPIAAAVTVEAQYKSMKAVETLAIAVARDAGKTAAEAAAEVQANFFMTSKELAAAPAIDELFDATAGLGALHAVYLVAEELKGDLVAGQTLDAIFDGDVAKNLVDTNFENAKKQADAGLTWNPQIAAALTNEIYEDQTKVGAVKKTAAEIRALGDSSLANFQIYEGIELAAGETFLDAFDDGVGDAVFETMVHMAEGTGDFAGDTFSANEAGLALGNVFGQFNGKTPEQILADKDEIMGAAGALIEQMDEFMALGTDPGAAAKVMDGFFGGMVDDFKEGAVDPNAALNSMNAMIANPDMIKDMEGASANALAGMMGSFVDSAKDGNFAASDATFFRDNARRESEGLAPRTEAEMQQQHQFHESGIDGEQLAKFEDLDAETREKFAALQALERQNSEDQPGPTASSKLFDGHTVATNAEDFIDYVEIMLFLSSDQRKALVNATGGVGEGATSTKPFMIDAIDAILGYMDEHNLHPDTFQADGGNAHTALNTHIKNVTDLSLAAGNAANRELFLKIGQVADSLNPNGAEKIGIPNIAEALIQAGKLGNSLLVTDTIGNNQFSNPQGMSTIYQTRAKLVSNGYNIHLIRLLGKYAFKQDPNQANHADSVANFLENTPSVFSDTGVTTSDLGHVFTTQSKNTDILGARKLGKTMRMRKIPRKNPDHYGAIVAKKLTIEGTGNLDLSSYFATTPDLAIAAVEEVHVKNAFTVSGGAKAGIDNGLSIGAPKVKIDAGVGIAFDGLYLGIGSDEDLTLNTVSLQSNDHLGLGSLGNVTLTNVSLLGGHRGRVYVYAQNTLTVDGAQFSQSLAEIYMEATTINLTNVSFPVGSDVTLKSRDGALNGKYPNFGSSLTGRVNFISNVKYGTHAINDEPSFDQHASPYISIEKF